MRVTLAARAYRFRGATVRNILEFTARVPGAKVEKLVTNYRSHKRIVTSYDTWMASTDWSNPDGLPFRYEKTISPDPAVKHPNYPAVFCIYATTEKDEGERFADLAAFLRQAGVVDDYSQVALLLHSVRLDHSGHFLAALEAKGIPAFCPRARAYFDNDEVRMMVACLALIFGYHGTGRGQISGGSLARLADYVDDCLKDLAKQYASPPPAVLRPRTVRARGSDHGIRPHAPPLRRILAAREDPRPDLPQLPQGPLFRHMAGAAPMAVCPEGPHRSPKLYPKEPHDPQALFQLHRGPEALRNLPTPVPILPRIRLHALPFCHHLLRSPRPPNHRGNPPHRPR